MSDNFIEDPDAPKDPCDGCIGKYSGKCFNCIHRMEKRKFKPK